MKYQNRNPNFSIVVPGPCNANCAFCFWDKSNNQNVINPADYIPKLFSALAGLPAEFRTVSITGGEPTMSPVFSAIIDALRLNRERFDRIVLTTNGFRALEVAPSLEGVVDFVNVSRHRVDDEANARVFNSRNIPGTAKLSAITQAMNQVGIPVTLSKVLCDDDVQSLALHNYLAFADNVGATSVFFRKPNGNLDPHPAEAIYSHLKAKESGCPVCLERSQIIDGMPVTWKRGILEPSDVGFHEVIMQPSGEMTTDWAGKRRVNLVDLKRMFARETEYARPVYIGWEPQGCGARVARAIGCGGGRVSSGCGGMPSGGCG